jgi:AcrR family transcriptional regulator
MGWERESAYTHSMQSADQNRTERRNRARNATRAAILQAARRIAACGGARSLSLRSVAAEAGFAPAALYGYFRNKDELMLALAADDLSQIANAMRHATSQHVSGSQFAAAASAALDFLTNTETLAAASAAMAAGANNGEVQRLFIGRLIVALTALSAAAGNHARSRGAQADVVLLAATLAGLAVLRRAGPLQALGFSVAEMLDRVEAHFSRMKEAA